MNIQMQNFGVYHFTPRLGRKSSLLLYAEKTATFHIEECKAAAHTETLQLELLNYSASTSYRRDIKIQRAPSTSPP